MKASIMTILLQLSEAKLHQTKMCASSHKVGEIRHIGATIVYMEVGEIVTIWKHFGAKTDVSYRTHAIQIDDRC